VARIGCLQRAITTNVNRFYQIWQTYIMSQNKSLIGVQVAKGQNIILFGNSADRNSSQH